MITRTLSLFAILLSSLLLVACAPEEKIVTVEVPADLDSSCDWEELEVTVNECFDQTDNEEMQLFYENYLIENTLQVSKVILECMKDYFCSNLQNSDCLINMEAFVQLINKGCISNES